MFPIRLPIMLALGLLSAPKAMALTLGANSKLCGVSASSTITNSGFTDITGAVCLSPGSGITGFPPGVATTTEVDSPIAVASQAEALTTFNTCKGLTPATPLTGPLGGITLGPGVYKFATTASLAGTLTLNASGNVNAQFIFQVGTTFSSATNSIIALKNGAKACNVFFCVGNAVLGGSNTLNGVFIANAGISVGLGTSDVGGLFSLTAAVTLLTNAVSKTGTSC